MAEKTFNTEESREKQRKAEAGLGVFLQKTQQLADKLGCIVYITSLATGGKPIVLAEPGNNTEKRR